MQRWSETTQALIVPNSGPVPWKVGRVFRLHGANGSDPELEAPTSSAPQRTAPQLRGLVFRKLFDTPGACVRVPFGPFAAVLWEQLSVPQRARPTDHFDCLVQVFHVLEPVPLSLIERVESAVSVGSRLRMLTRGRAEALGLPSLDTALPEAAPETAPPVLEPGQVLWSLTLLADPTHDMRSRSTEDRADLAPERHPEEPAAPPRA